MMDKVQNSSEIGVLKKLLIHSPDVGIGNLMVGKLEDWLYDDIVDLGKIQTEYHYYHLLLLAFLKPEKLFKDDKLVLLDEVKPNKQLLDTSPDSKNYYLKPEETDNASVLDVQFLLQQTIKNNLVEARDLIVSICFVENIDSITKNILLLLLEKGAENDIYYNKLVNILISGKLEFAPDQTGKIKKVAENHIRYIFPPLPNFIFTRDIAVSVGDHLIIPKPKYDIRRREIILMRFLAENYFFKNDFDKIISVSEDDYFLQLQNQNELSVSYEGGDIIVISDKHLLIGWSERTSPYAIQKLIYQLFLKNIKTKNPNGIEIISVIKIGAHRSQMHIDTILSHVREDVWFLHSPLSEQWQTHRVTNSVFYKELHREFHVDKGSKSKKEVDILQFYLHPEAKKLKAEYWKTTDSEERISIKNKFEKLDFFLEPDAEGNYQTDCIYQKKPQGLHDFLVQISTKEFGVSSGDKVKVVFSGGGIPPYDTREQWTDACNLLCLRSGIAIGYDRNIRTSIHFNQLMEDNGEAHSDYPGFIDFAVQKNRERFARILDQYPDLGDLKYLLYAKDLFRFIQNHNLSLEETKKLIASIKNTVILLPSGELSRARGGSHCMSMPLIRE